MPPWSPVIPEAPQDSALAPAFVPQPEAPPTVHTLSTPSQPPGFAVSTTRSLSSPLHHAGWASFSLDAPAPSRQASASSSAFDSQTSRPIVAAMVCSAGHRFCFYHSIAHSATPGACQAYMIQLAKERSRVQRLACAKTCPGCGVMTERAEGCTHMTCPSCKANWCWVCGQHLTSQAGLGWHYNPANPLGCNQFTGRSEQRYSVVEVFARLLAWPGAVLGTAVFWLTFPTWICCCCFGVALTMICVLFLQCAWLPVGCLLSVLVVPCRPDSGHYHSIMFGPVMSALASLECLGCFRGDA